MKKVVKVFEIFKKINENIAEKAAKLGKLSKVS